MTNYYSECSPIFPIFFQNYENEYENDYSLTNGTSDSFSDAFNLCHHLFQRDSLDNSFDNELQNLSSKDLDLSKKNEKKCIKDIKENIFKESKDNNIENINESFRNEEKDSSENIFIQLSRKKRGRNKIKGSNEIVKIHDKFSTDNLLRKIQVHYMTFIICFINEILNQLNYQQTFLKLDYEYKKNVSKKFSDLLKNKNLSDIICNKISNKYKKEDINKNKIIYEQIKDDLIFKNLFKENYLEFFKNIYYKSVNKINLIKYGLNKEIILPKNKVKMFKDLIEEKTEEDEDYIKNLHLCVAQNYLPKNTFLMY